MAGGHQNCTHSRGIGLNMLTKLKIPQNPLRISYQDASFFQHDGKVANSILPAHCLNIFIPLVDVESNNGGTEFCLGSHFNTKFFTEDIVWQDVHWKDRIGFKGDVLAIKVNAGEVLAFDYRVLHR